MQKGLSSGAFQFIAEWEQRHRNHLEVLHGKGNADDGDGEDEAGKDVRQRDFPAKQQQPQDVKAHRQTALPAVFGADGFAERQQRRPGNLQGRQPERNADDRQAQQNPADGIAQRSQQPTYDQPENIAE